MANARPKREFSAVWSGAMRKLDIFDSLFENSISMAGDKRDFKPTHFEWNKEPESPKSPLFFTESHMGKAHFYAEDNIDCYLILIEPEALHPENYQRALELERHFVGIFTHDARYADLDAARDKWHFYPFGGSWIANPEITRKVLDVGIIASHKESMPGHKLRHKVVRHLNQHFVPCAWGSGYKPFDSKQRVLADYRFMVVIENVRQDYWFTEKLLDALSMGCIPIYWGCPDIGRWFDMDGIIPVETFDDLRIMLHAIDFEKEYEDRFDAIKANAKRAKDFFICEDVLYNTYPTVFSKGL